MAWEPELVGDAGCGAAVTFVGYCRSASQDGDVTRLDLEHYPGFTEKEISRLAQRVAARRALAGLLVIHRFGTVLPGEPIVLVAENPTRGLDVQATRAVHDRLREAAARGLAVLVYASDLDEVLTLGTRVVVMNRGQLVEAPPGASRETIGRMMLGAGND